MSRYELYAPRYPLLPLKNVVIFPRNIVTLLVGRPRSIQAVEDSLARDRRIVVTAHRDSESEEPRPEDLYTIGALAEIVSVERQQGNSVQVVLEGISRVRVGQFDTSRPFFTVTTDELREPVPPIAESRALLLHVQELASKYNEARSKLSPEVLDMVQRATEPGHLADLLATQLLTDTARRQSLLELLDPVKRLEQIAVQMTGDLDVAALEQKIKDRVREQVEKNQREYYLREQLKAIHDELSGEGGNEIEALRQRITARGVPAEVEEKLLRELTRLERMPSVSAEATVVRTYLDTMLGIPWHEQSEDQLDLDEAERILNEDHYGLEQVKERILDFLAVRKLRVDAGTTDPGTAQILCLIGPPGVGKTSLGRSIATSMDRKFVRVSLGGVRDEAEIRGHRRTYIGAMPGRVIGAMKTAGTVNPLILLDEIDKLSSDFRGDPAAALLEVLDPEQNQNFTDHFLDAPYDLSKVLFITTANYGHQIPRPLRDRMEIIELSGYTEEEKIEIGKRYLLRKQLAAHGLPKESLEIPANVWQRIVREYTREAGVRELDREVAAICRKVARDIVKGKTSKVKLTDQRLEEILGPRRFGYDHELDESQIGLAIGLGTTEVGGELIPVEVATMPGRGGLTITGRAGDVMQESARAALSYARSRADQLKIDRDFQEKLDLHIHLPEGATPKDGPSAGITMATALISALTRCPVRNDTAMTGEITLRGRVLAIGGLKDKTLAAHRQNIRRLIAPADNRRDLQKIPEAIRKEMEFIFVTNMDEVIAAAILLDESQAGNLVGAATPSEDAESSGSRVPPPGQAVPFGDVVVTDATGQ
ncbi:MAG: ATP-dependent Lon protease [Thermomicrobiales bacterium]|jgi:ATP-dependent Lon protease|nr:ATP-dependent Lon protease [Thermomicrobiales bacterium]